MDMQSRFITIEGGEGSGKSSAILEIQKYFETKGYNVMISREPGGLSHLESLREIMLNNDFSLLSQMYLFGVTRLEHLNNKILPFLNASENNVVICDRFIDSSLVYQGIVGNLGLSKVYNLNYELINGFLPRYTFYLNVEPSVGLSRIFNDIEREKNHFDKKDLSFHDLVHKGYCSLLNSEYDNGRFIEINANNNLDSVLLDIRNSLLNLDY